MATSYPGAYNVQIPFLETSGNLHIDFSTNLKFAVNRVATITPVKSLFGTYLYHRPEDRGKLLSVPDQDVWDWAQNRPNNSTSARGFEQKSFEVKRYSRELLLDQTAIDNANWPLLKHNIDGLAHDMMLRRGYQVYTKMFDSNEYSAAHIKTGTVLGGDFLDKGHIGKPVLRNALMEADKIIQNATGSRIRPGMLSVLMNHNTAIKLSQTREIHEFLANQEKSESRLTLKEDSFNGAYYLPDTLYRHNVVIEDLQYQASPKGASTEAFTPLVPDNKMLVFYQDPSPQESTMSGSFSTCHVFMYEDMKPEMFPDLKNRTLTATVTDIMDVKIVAPITAVLITNVFE